MSGVLSGIGVTWRAIQVLQESSLTIPGMTKYSLGSENSLISNFNVGKWPPHREKPSITFGPGIWFGWISMTLLLAGGMALGKFVAEIGKNSKCPLHVIFSSFITTHSTKALFSSTTKRKRGKLALHRISLNTTVQVDSEFWSLISNRIVILLTKFWSKSGIFLTALSVLVHKLRAWVALPSTTRSYLTEIVFKRTQRCPFTRIKSSKTICSKLY